MNETKRFLGVGQHEMLRPPNLRCTYILVKLLLERSANVLAVDVDQAKGLALAEETGALYRLCDVGDLTQWQQLVDYLKSEQADLGAPTRIHLNAGIQIAPPDAPLSEYQLEAATLERYRRMMSVNVDGIVFGLQTLLPILARKGGPLGSH